MNVGRFIRSPGPEHFISIAWAKRVISLKEAPLVTSNTVKQLPFDLHWKLGRLGGLCLWCRRMNVAWLIQSLVPVPRFLGAREYSHVTLGDGQGYSLLNKSPTVHTFLTCYRHISTR